MPILLLFFLVFSVNESYAQGRPKPKPPTVNISPTSDFIITLQKPPKFAPYNIALVARADYGAVTHGAGIGRDIPFMHSGFVLTALEWYIPIHLEKTRLLFQTRFSTPYDIYNTNYTSLFQPRLGFGVGASTIFYDSVSESTGKGTVAMLNYLSALEFEFLDNQLAESNAFKEEPVILRFELGLRWNFFLRKNFALMIGIDTSFGMSFQEYYLQLENNTYPVLPLSNYGKAVRPFATVGLVFGFLI